MAEKLVLTTTSLNNLVIANANDVIYYEVVTHKWESATTRISRLDPDSRELEVVAETRNENRTRRPIAVRLRGEEFRPASEFLVTDEESSSPINGKFKGKDGKYYTWRVRKRRLELVQDDTPDAKPVATYSRHRRYFFMLRMSRHPCLEIEPSIMETLDSVILSFLLIRRRHAKSS